MIGIAITQDWIELLKRPKTEWMSHLILSLSRRSKCIVISYSENTIHSPSSHCIDEFCGTTLFEGCPPSVGEEAH